MANAQIYAYTKMLVVRMHCVEYLNIASYVCALTVIVVNQHKAVRNPSVLLIPIVKMISNVKVALVEIPAYEAVLVALMHSVV